MARVNEREMVLKAGSLLALIPPFGTFHSISFKRDKN